MNTQFRTTSEQHLRGYEISIDNWEDGHHDTNLLRDVRIDLANSKLSADQKARLDSADETVRRLYEENQGKSDSFDVIMLKSTLEVISGKWQN